MKLFHTTPIDRIPEVLRHGLLPRKERVLGCGDARDRYSFVFLFDTIESAVLYAKTFHWAYNNAVIEVSVPSKWVEPDDFNEKNPWLPPDPPGSFRTQKAIPPRRITRLFTEAGP